MKPAELRQFEENAIIISLSNGTVLWLMLYSHCYGDCVNTPRSFQIAINLELKHYSLNCLHLSFKINSLHCLCENPRNKDL